MCQAPCKEPCCCCIGCFPFTWCCVQFEMRKRVLKAQDPNGGWPKNYECGQGYFECLCFKPGHMGEKTCPRCCLCCETICCPGLSVSGSRLLMMDMHSIQPDPCDNRIIRLNNCLQLLSCLCWILAIIDSTFYECARIIDCIADVVFLCSSGCMVAQVNRELKLRHSVGAPLAADAASQDTLTPVASALMNEREDEFDATPKKSLAIEAQPSFTKN